ncbi:lipopolysaccharide cholinephosphotransferase [Mycoplasmopsis anatis]|uniref:Lipopolysaccharide cholinephosphotransferase n=1 Tax=Mycoplasmopsis anatis TaxID=171279 RepID=A0A9Q3QDJ2_9BACT|nr:LicD family protein [Mycoplasmopsis anatis]MBW0595195.1 lipopolysaccharide cholinephosphotransferase [Mycoplasmopsis anatis]MBW0595898.1 lipopolysaccharide cholinephosphotransferase [Mycoplasmopsis anatis]MBW0596771.1 lipopolysaccharide cholinephosphotransferase [Mycoplasmopsis anatis]MBW0597183.1 lipopolysaccharide cholinephosphotransferase [Mycoplasmopsis anatis]MBW0599589.1 lipopolysaccharide cholinephosphotransferase [Mycoplasmopsis anatis]
MKNNEWDAQYLHSKHVKLKSLLKELISIFEKNNLKYVAYYGTLLGAIRHNNIIPWDDDVDLVIDYDTLEFLIKNYPNLVKVGKNSNNFLMMAKYTHDREDEVDATFIDLFVVVPTNKEKLKKFRKLTNKLRYFNYYANRKVSKELWHIKILRFFFFWTRKLPKFTLEEAINQVRDTKVQEKQFIITWPDYANMQKTTFPLEWDFFDSELCKFDDFYIAVPKKYNDFLVKEYGKNWHIHKKTLLSEHYGMYDVKI